MAARNQFGHHHAFMAGLVCQPGRTGNVADGIQPLNPRAAILIRHHMGAVDPDPQRLQPQIFGIADNAHGGNHRVKGHSFGLAALLDLRGHADARLAVQRFDGGFFKDFHALLDELLLCKGGNFGIFHRQDAVQHLHHGRIGPQRVEEAGEFNADGP